MSLTRRELLHRVGLGSGVVALGDLGSLLGANPASATTSAATRAAAPAVGPIPTRTAAELFASLRAGSTVDLAGETIESTDVDAVPLGVTVQNGTFLGQMQLYGANGLTLERCTFVGDPTTELKTVCKFLGGDGWQVLDSTFRGGIVQSQLGMGLNSRVIDRRSVPVNWLVRGCTFETLDGQAGDYPQGHQVYCLTSPTVNMSARIENCMFSGSPFGAPLKLGGTGNNPHTEGVRGVTVTECVINGVFDVAGRCLAVLTQGQRTDVTLVGCTLTAAGGATPWVQANDGSRLRMLDAELPQGVVEYASWWLTIFFFPTDQKFTVAPGQDPPDIPGHITWSALPVGVGFHSLTPGRVLDTRNGVGLSGRFASGQTRDLMVTGVAGVPSSGVTAVVVNVTAVGPDASTFLTVWPAGTVQPTASSLNVPPGDTRANLVVAKVGVDGQVSLFNNAGTTDVLADVVGYFDDGTEVADLYNSLAPGRVLDTRNGVGLSGRFASGQTRDLMVTGVAGVPSSGVTAVVVNVTAVGPDASTFLTVWPAGTVQPTASSLNVPPGDTRANLVVAKVGANGQVSIFNNAGTTDVLADVVGYYTSTGSGYTALAPGRVLDTRDGTGLAGRFTAAQTRDLMVAGVAGVPSSGVSAVVVNVTGVLPDASTFLTVWPAGTVQPTASSLNVPPGDTRANLVVAKVGANGQVSIFNNAGTTDVVADVVGYYS